MLKFVANFVAMKCKSQTTLSYGLLLLYAYFCYLMLLISLQYVPLDTDVAFLRIKQDYVSRTYYQWAFFIHVYSAILVLPAGFTQFSKRIRIVIPQVHRTGGWIYLAIVIFLAGPSGIVIGIHANGGWSSQLAFCLLGVLWIYFSWVAFQKIKSRDIQAHRYYMYRSFALALSAITLRGWKYLIVAIWHPRPMDAYRWVAWLGWVLNLIIAEFIIFYLKKRKA